MAGRIHLLIPCLIPALAVVLRAAGPDATPAGLNAIEQQLVAYVDSHQEEFAADLAAAVQIDSATENLAGVRQLGESFARDLAAIGFDARFRPLPASTGRSGHLVAEHRGTRGKRVLLIGQLDTVFPGANYHRDGMIASGSGVADMKGGDIVLLHALRALQAAGALADTQIIVVLTGDEEAPGDPLEVTRRELLEAARRSDLALAFESAIGHTGTVARRGIVGWELEVQGATGHSSGIFSAAVGSGAVFEAARILSGFYEQLRRIDGVTCNPALVAGGTEADLTRTGGTISGKSNIIAQRTLVRGDLRYLSAAQLAEAQKAMAAVVKDHLPRTSAELRFLGDGYPAMSPTPENYALLAQLDQASRDLGFGEITAFDPRGRGAGDVSFVSPPLPALDGLGLGGKGEHTTHESTDLTTAPELVKRAAVLIYRLTR
jgi:glutamate carboxypeptidase